VDCGLIFKKYRAFLQCGGNKAIPGFNLQLEIPWTESTVRWIGDVLRSTVDHGRHCGSPELIGGAQQGEGGHGELDGLLTGARAAAWRRGDGVEERRWLELVTGAKEGANGLGREGERCGEVRGWCSPFIGGGEAPGRGGRGVMVALMSLTPLKTMRLRGGLRRGS
jgi:hypothetical protein